MVGIIKLLNIKIPHLPAGTIDTGVFVIHYFRAFVVDVHEYVHRDTIMKVTNKMQLYR